MAVVKSTDQVVRIKTSGTSSWTDISTDWLISFTASRTARTFEKGGTTETVRNVTNGQVEETVDFSVDADDSLFPLLYRKEMTDIDIEDNPRGTASGTPKVTYTNMTITDSSYENTINDKMMFEVSTVTGETNTIVESTN